MNAPVPLSPPDPRRDPDRLLHRLLGALNRAADVREVLQRVLADLLAGLDLSTGWIVLRDEAAQDPVAGPGFILAAHVNLPSALGLDRRAVWSDRCTCEARCVSGSATVAYNELACPRLVRLRGEGHARAAHASVPLTIDGEPLGMLNVAREDWSPLEDDVLRQLERLGGELGAAIARSRVHERLLGKRLEEQSVMLELSQDLLVARDPDAIIATLLARARSTLEADACALLLPDAHERGLRYRGAAGWADDPVAAGRVVPLEAPCSANMAMWARRPVLYEDLARDPEGRTSARWVAEAGTRGHLAVPLVADDRALGVLLVNLQRPRRFQEYETRFAQLLAETAALALASAARREEEQEQALLRYELGLAREIQRTLMPMSAPRVPGWDLALAYEPAQAVGGDLYELAALPRDPRRLVIAVGDVAGKSVSAALLMVSTLAAMREAFRTEDDPVAVLEGVNARLRRRIRGDRFVTAFCGVLDPATGHLRYAGAGHPPPLYVTPDAPARELPVGGAALGLFDRTGVLGREITLEPGASLLVFSDGIPEAMDPGCAMFGDERLRACVDDLHGGGAQALVAGVCRRVAAFRRTAAPSDDLTMIALHRPSAASPADAAPGAS